MFSFYVQWLTRYKNYSKIYEVQSERTACKASALPCELHPRIDVFFDLGLHILENIPNVFLFQNSSSPQIPNAFCSRFPSLNNPPCREFTADLLSLLDAGALSLQFFFWLVSTGNLAFSHLRTDCSCYFRNLFWYRKSRWYIKKKGNGTLHLFLISFVMFVNGILKLICCYLQVLEWPRKSCFGSWVAAKWA